MIRQMLLNVLKWLDSLIRDKLHSKNRHLRYYVAILIAVILFVLALASFVELTEELAENELAEFDDWVSTAIISLRNDQLTGFFRFTTHLGDKLTYGIMGVLMAAYFYIRKRSWKFIAQTSVVLALSTLSNIFLKSVINRSRPAFEHLVSVDTLSYPSGHSMSAMAFYGFLIYLCLRYEMNTALRIVAVSILVLLILTVGVSRIYLGVHFPSDVVAGYVGGLIWVTFCAVVFDVTELARKGNGSTDNR